MATTNEAWTVRRVLEWTIEHLKKSGSDTPRLDAEILLAHSRGCPRIQLYVQYDQELGDDERLTMRELVKRRAAHEPVAYLVGHREFFGIDFEVRKGVLIRPDTETLVIQTLEFAKHFAAPRILELCTGSGCVAVAVARNCPQASVTTVEIDDTALQIARSNIAKHALGEQIELLQGDLFHIVPGREFDIVVSNPPYVPDAEIATLDADVRLHEPELALRGGVDGLDIVRRIVRDASQYLVPGGPVLLEISSEQAETVVELFRLQGNFEPARIKKDLAGKSRVVWTRRQ